MLKAVAGSIGLHRGTAARFAIVSSDRVKPASIWTSPELHGRLAAFEPDGGDGLNLQRVYAAVWRNVTGGERTGKALTGLMSLRGC